jgi:ribosome-associated protein
MESSAKSHFEGRSAKPDDDGLAFACGAARVAADHKSDDVVVLDLRGLSSLADFFVIGTGTSERQMHAVVNHLEDYGRSVGRKPFKVSDSSAASWILADYVDVVIHLFDAEHRAYYDLDGLWGDAPRMEWSSAAPGDRNADAE